MDTSVSLFVFITSMVSWHGLARTYSIKLELEKKVAEEYAKVLLVERPTSAFTFKFKLNLNAFIQEKALVGAFSVIIKLRGITSNLRFKLYIKHH